MLGAVQLYQTEAPPELPAWRGSPGCLVALVVSTMMVPEAPASTAALAKLSLAGGGPAATTKLVALVAVPTFVWTVMGPVVGPPLGGFIVTVV